MRYRNLISNLYNVTNGILLMHKYTGESEISYKDYESLIRKIMSFDGKAKLTVICLNGVA